MKRVSCNTCPKRASCTRICKELEKQLPQLDDGVGWAELNCLDREVVWSIQDREDELPLGWRRIAYLYFRLGWSQKEVAAEVSLARSSVSAILAHIRASIGGRPTKTS